jgi:putrescine transport system permease protein
MAGVRGRGRWWVIVPPFVWLGVFFLLPFGIVVRMSLSDAASAQPPYRPVIDLSAGFAALWQSVRQFDLENYQLLLSDDLYGAALLSSLRIAFIATVITLLIAYPLAHATARAPKRLQPILIILLVLPFWTSFLIRVYAWIAILKQEGLLNALLESLGLISTPLVILNTETAVLIGIVYSYLPFMVLPIYAALERQDPTLLEAAADLGCPPWKAFWTITLPLSLGGVIAGCLLVFIPAVGEFVIPDLLGGSDTLMIGRTLWSEFFSNRDWPLASAVAVVLLVLLVGPILMYRAVEQQNQRLRH